MDLATNQKAARHRLLLSDVTLASFGSTPVKNVAVSQQSLAKWRCGRIIVQDRKLNAVHRRWWPYVGNLFQARWDQKFPGGSEDRCELFYHQPLSSQEFITLSYVRSTQRTSLSTFYGATLLLDEIARLKGSLAIVCHVTNDRLSDRLLKRWGWDQHCEHWSGRHFIKRFYGEYPDIGPPWRSRLTLDA